MVLSGPPAPAAIEEILCITGLDAARFDKLYWADRHAFDEGKLTGIAFWKKLARDGGLTLGEQEISELCGCDARMWSTINPLMLAWCERLKASGIKIAILSNIGDTVREHIVREFDWLRRFDALVWSYELGIAKPDAAIYRHALERLGVAANEAFFLDDKPVNVAAARALGIRGVAFFTVERLREDLIAMGLDAELPLPG